MYFHVSEQIETEEQSVVFQAKKERTVLNFVKKKKKEIILEIILRKIK